MNSGNTGTPVVAAFGELILRLHSSQQLRFIQTSGYDAYYGGAEANVCVLLSRLGVQTEFISRIPSNDLSHAGVKQLRSYGVGTSHIQYGGDILGMYFTESGNQVRSSRVIYNRSGSAFAESSPGMLPWQKILQGADYFHWSGVSAAISESAAGVCSEAVNTAAELGITICSDFNYRSTLWKYGKHPSEIMPPLVRKSKIIIADLDSAEVYFRISTNKADTLPERFRVCALALKKELPAMEYLAMSFRQVNGLTHHYSGALMVKDEFIFHDGFQLAWITDQIGSGDAFTAGLLYGIMHNQKGAGLLGFALACGALKQSMMGDWAIITKEEAEQFVASGGSGRIIR